MNTEFEYARYAIKQGACDYILKNEITKDSVLTLLNRLIKKTDSHHTFENHANDTERFSLKYSIGSKFIHQLLLTGTPISSIEELRANYIEIDDTLLFALATPWFPKKLYELKLENWVDIFNISYYSYEQSKQLLLIGNLKKADPEIIQKLAIFIQEQLNCIVGYSGIGNGIGELIFVVKDAVNMSCFAFYDRHNTREYREWAEKSDDGSAWSKIEELQRGLIKSFEAHHYGTAKVLFGEYLDMIGAAKLMDVSSIKDSIIKTVSRINSNYSSIQSNIYQTQRKILESSTFAEVRRVLEPFIAEMGELKKYSKSILSALEYIKQNYMHQCSLSEVAGVVFISEGYFSRLFKKEVGITYSEYLNRVRMDAAMNMILSTNMSITAISEQVGIPNSKYFSLLFRKHFNKTPMQVRDPGHGFRTEKE